jgi:WD40 repeat protein
VAVQRRAAITKALGMAVNADEFHHEMRRVDGVMRRLDEQETRSDQITYDMKVSAILESLSPAMLKLVEKRPRGVQSDFDRECMRRGVNVEHLRDLQAAFATTDESGGGIGEDEFVRMFGPTLCKAMTPSETRMWFRTIDDDCSGTISWQEISQYVSAYHGDAEKRGAYFIENTIEPVGPPLASRRPHKSNMTGLLYNPSLNAVYSAGADGIVNSWDPATLLCRAEAVHDQGCAVIDMSYLPHNNRLIVLQADRSMFVYDTFADMERNQKHEVYRAFATKNKSAKVLHDGSAFYEPPVRRRHEAMTARRVLAATLLAPSADLFCCVDHLGGSATAFGEPVAVGTEAGQLELYDLILGSKQPLVPHTAYAVHDSWVTRVRFAPQMQACITSSLDGTVCVTDLDSGLKTQTLRSAGKPKPLYGFEYHPESHVLLSYSGRSVYVWNALTGARLTSLVDHDAIVTSVSHNADKNHVYVMQENKKMKIWDLRTWRCIGDADDPLDRRASRNVMWCEPAKVLLGGYGQLFGWRPSEVQLRLDAGLRAEETDMNVHLAGIVATLPVHSASHIFSLDAMRVIVWGSKLKRPIGSWAWPHIQDYITAVAFALDNVKLLLGTESGRVYCVNYASGFLIYEMKHAHSAANVEALLATPGVVEAAPPVTFAAIRRQVVCWCASENHEGDIEAPSFTYRLPAAQRGRFSSLCNVDNARKLLFGATTCGACVLFSLNLTALYTLDLEAPDPERPIRVDSATVVHPSLLVLLCGDGKARFVGVEYRQHVMHLIAAPHVAYGDDGVNCCAITGTTLVVGDGSGVVSVFDCPYLLDAHFVRHSLLPHMDSDPKAMKKAAHFIELKHAVWAHDGAVTGLQIMDGEVFSASVDKHLRAWRVGSWAMTSDMGSEELMAPRRLPGAAGKKHGALGSVVTADHPYTQRLPDMRRGQSNVALGATLSSLSAQGTPPLSAMPSAPQLASLPSNAALSPPAQHPRRASKAVRRGVRLSALDAIPVVQEAPDERTAVFTHADLFRTATDRIVGIAPRLVRHLPAAAAEEERPRGVAEQLFEVARLRQSRIIDPHEGTKRAFCMLTLAKMPPRARSSMR